jgi:LPS-assembly protein
MAGFTTTRLLGMRGCGRVARAAAIAAIGCSLVAGGLRPASAQMPMPDNWVGIPKPPPNANQNLMPSPKKDPNAQMLVRADQLNYDYNNSRVLAVGNVQIYYNGSTLEADRVIYDQKTKRLHAEGGARLTEADGKVVYGEILDLNDEFRDGFVDSLRLETPDKLRFAAPHAQRAGANTTVFESGTYTACEPCKDDPRKPPKWQVKGVRIIHDENEKMLYFENMRLEVFGVPLFWSPFFSTPDPSVKRKSGFLTPTPSYSSTYGVGITIPYYFDLAPNYDFLFKPTITTQQGPLLEGTWRQRFETGSLSVHAAGILQADPGQFVTKDGPGYPGDRTFRGEVDSAGQFSLNDKWVWGWDGLLMTDKVFFQDYRVNDYYIHFNNFNTFSNGITDAGTSQVYLIGRGDRSYFDARLMYFYGLSLPVACHSGRLFARFSRGHLEGNGDRFPWPIMDAVRDPARRRRQRLDQQPTRCRQFRDHRHERRHPVHAGRRRRIPLSVHQHRIVGHADNCADRPGDRPSQRNQHRQTAQRRLTKLDFRRQQPVQGG